MQLWEANHIDDTFKQAAANASFPYQVNHWNAIDAKLSAAQKNALLVKAGVLSLIILLFSALTFFSVRMEDTSDTIQNEIVQKKQGLIPYNQENEHSVIITNDKNEDTIKNQEQSNSSQNESVGMPSNKPMVGSSDVQGISTPKNEENKEYHGANQTIQPKVSLEHITDSSYDLWHFKNANWPGGRFIESHLNTDMDSKEIIPLKSKNLLSRFELGISIESDFTGVDFKGNRPGYGIGVVIGYQLTQRISISSGIFYGKKAYEISEGYKPYDGIWKKVQEPDHIKAECKVFEIPVNVRFNLISSIRNKVFVSTGVSTYFMNREDYLFIYPWNSIRTLIVARGENKHFFGIYNLSFGLERKLTDRFGLQVEPYIKVPLTGIGIGQVNLTSLGTFITGKYYFK